MLIADQPPTRPSVSVAPARADDLTTTATLHVQHLPHGLFPQLGRRFMAAWHRPFVESRHGVALVARDVEGRVVGFLLGTTCQRSFNAAVITGHRTSLLVRGAVGLVTRPRALALFLRTRAPHYARRLSRILLRRRAAVAQVAATPGSDQVGVLHAAVVVPEARGRRVGEALLDEFVRTAAERGADVLQLVTRAGDEGAGRFYERNGWTAVDKREDRSGNRIVQYDLDLHARIDR